MLVSEEFDGGIGKDTQEGCGVAAEEPTHAVLPVDVTHGGHDAEPGTGVFCKLGVGRLKENLDAVERADDGFGLVLRAN